MPRTFRTALIDALERTGRSLASVTEQAGVSHEQFKKLIQREGSRTNVDDAIRVARAFGLTLDEFLQDDLATDRLEIAQLYSQLSPAERTLLRATARGLRGQGQDQG